MRAFLRLLDWIIGYFLLAPCNRRGLARLFARRSGSGGLAGLGLAVQAAAMTGLALALLPDHPLALPAAIGLGTAVSIYIQMGAVGLGAKRVQKQ